MTMSFSQRHPPIPDYEPIRLIGQNGAIVYLARSTRLDKPAALQVWWRRPLPTNAASIVGLKHPNIVEVFDVGEVDEHSYFAFEHVQAETLAQRLREGPLSDIEARRCATAIISALQFAREAGAVVADLTPGTVLLTEPLKLFLHPAALDNPRLGFTAPEAGDAALTDTTAAADVYRVGALLYAMLTTQPPIPTKLAQRGHEATLAAYVPVPPRQVNVAVGEQLGGICLKCLEPAPSNRYGSLREVANALIFPDDKSQHAV